MSDLFDITPFLLYQDKAFLIWLLLAIQIFLAYELCRFTAVCIIMYAEKRNKHDMRSIAINIYHHAPEIRNDLLVCYIIFFIYIWGNSII